MCTPTGAEGKWRGRFHLRERWLLRPNTERSSQRSSAKRVMATHRGPVMCSTFPAHSVYLVLNLCCYYLWNNSDSNLAATSCSRPLINCPAYQQDTRGPPPASPLLSVSPCLPSLLPSYTSLSPSSLVMCCSTFPPCCIRPVIALFPLSAVLSQRSREAVSPRTTTILTLLHRRPSFSLTFELSPCGSIAGLIAEVTVPSAILSKCSLRLDNLCVLLRLLASHRQNQHYIIDETVCLSDKNPYSNTS